MGDSRIGAEDVVITAGGSAALDMAMTILASPGQNILIPRPAYFHYRYLARGIGVEVKEYNLLPEQRWEVNLAHLEAKIDHKTAALLVNNPSNPCGTVYSEAHLKDVLAIAEKHRLAIIADEMYAFITLPGSTFTPLAKLTDKVPILAVGGLTKRFLVPGWRVGWLTIHDQAKVLKDFKLPLIGLAQRHKAINSLAQGALPTILSQTPQSYFDKLTALIEDASKAAMDVLSKVPGLNPTMPQGAFYMMIGYDEHVYPIEGVKFCADLMAQESVQCFPGILFGIEHYFRITVASPVEVMLEACQRIKTFCEAKRQK